jgi:hypothetical protein
MDRPYQDLACFEVPFGFRGRPAAVIARWLSVQGTAFASSPPTAYFWRRRILRRFGARVGRGVPAQLTSGIGRAMGVIVPRKLATPVSCFIPQTCGTTSQARGVHDRTEQ